ncbi:MAG: glycine betaine ABC transporter substrate-binding protein [Xenococcaceae cyanobacterium MO_207.B15]|nr:glycine betaine ABC transporter substrate-binding protein [Xenococcaceae cyanobacterium MO_207.B15]
MLIREFIVSNYRATDQFLVLLGFIFIPVFSILILIYVINNYNSISLIFGDKEIKFKEKIKNEVITEIVKNITASTESTVYSLASFMIVEPKTVSNYIQTARGDSNQIIVGCQDYTEQRILCAIITKLLQINKSDLDSNLEVIPKYNLGGVGLNFIALSRGDIDIYPAYTWQGFEMVYGTYLSQKRESLIDKKGPNSTEAKSRISELNSLYSGNNGNNENNKSLSIPLKWICYTGFHDNWNIVVREDYAREKNIEKISQLKQKSCQPLCLACEYDFFARPNGYRLLTSPDGYGLKFEKTILIDHEKAYEVLQNKENEVDIIDGFTTDPELNDSIYRILEDDKKQFGRYYSSILVRQELLKKYKKLEDILKLLEDKIKPKNMTKMIREIDQGSKTIEETANEFLNNLTTNVPNEGK